MFLITVINKIILNAIRDCSLNAFWECILGMQYLLIIIIERNLESYFGNAIWEHFWNALSYFVNAIWKQFGNAFWERNTGTEFRNMFLECNWECIRNTIQKIMYFGSIIQEFILGMQLGMEISSFWECNTE